MFTKKIVMAFLIISLTAGVAAASQRPAAEDGAPQTPPVTVPAVDDALLAALLTTAYSNNPQIAAAAPGEGRPENLSPLFFSRIACTL